ncbi:unnamed protein product [Adineta steineri]|uniref:Transmembrane protein 9 n=1 Tax=Adineta steineri TaxID=433720 RepID=A0A814WTK0_9BILA|nr:unnamed protein product [Adineta steineri]CAF1208810.1 unnamed protein product [Adineta steineri]CAF1210088.1 unnamed protein product [Adineta steineri]CAF1352563.1 unnamed protein product [Adineta steineri]CAF3576405.1 unnamed protein product [Adineta steineri]
MLNRLIILVLFFSSIWLIAYGGDEFEDYRCRCICPSFTVLQDPSMNETHRRVYIDVVAPDNCTCERVVFHTITASSSFQQRFCPRCVCNYEVRNTTTMKVVVIIIMVAISLLFIYMSFLLCLDPLMNQNKKPTTATTTTSNTTRPQRHYERQVNDELHLDNPTQECIFSEPAPASGLTRNTDRSSTVLNLVTHEQSKWRKNVQQQRQSVYNKHELLN